MTKFNFLDDDIRITNHKARLNTTHKPCDHFGCKQYGLYKAPQNPSNLNSYFWFCLEHIRNHNKNWNFFAGRSEEEVRRHIEADVVGHRPTWAMGQIRNINQTNYKQRDFSFFYDPFDILDKKSTQQQPSSQPSLTSDMKKAMAIFNIELPIDYKTLKTTYKSLAKKHHPDVSENKKEAEKIFRDIVWAYDIIKKILNYI